MGLGRETADVSLSSASVSQPAVLLTLTNVSGRRDEGEERVGRKKKYDLEAFYASGSEEESTEGEEVEVEGGGSDEHEDAHEGEEEEVEEDEGGRDDDHVEGSEGEEE